VKPDRQDRPRVPREQQLPLVRLDVLGEVRVKQGGEVWADRDAADGAGRLRWSQALFDGELGVGVLEAAGDGDFVVVEVDVLGAQGEGFALAQPGEGGDADERPPLGGQCGDQLFDLRALSSSVVGRAGFGGCACRGWDRG